jgi:flagellar hook-associated protein 1 FlgK
MSLSAALSITTSGLAHVQRQLAQAAQDVANAGTAGYTRKTIAGRSAPTEGGGGGVTSLGVAREVDAALQAEANAARSQAAGAALRETLLRGVERAHGTTEEGNSLAGALAVLRSALVTLREAPGETLRQNEVVAAAGEVASRFRTISSAIGEARQQAQDGMAAEVAALNAGLRETARLDRLIRVETAAGRSTAELDDQRDAAIGALSDSLQLRVIEQKDGGVLLVARGGLVLPLDENSDAFSIAPATVGPEAYHGAGGTLPGVTLDGVDVTGQLAGGRLAALLELRDATLPRFQAELDLAAAQTAARFEAQGLRLFTDAAGAVPDISLPGDVVGFAGAIRVNAGVQAEARLVRDGTHVVAGDPAGATAFTPNPADGPAGFSTLMDRVLGFTFGAEVAAGVAQPGFPASGLGPDGTLESMLPPTATLEAYASQLTAAQTGERAAASRTRAQAETLGTSLQARIAEQSGVDVEREMAAMVELQNAYAANARVLSTVQQMWDALYGAVR